MSNFNDNVVRGLDEKFLKSYTLPNNLGPNNPALTRGKGYMKRTNGPKRTPNNTARGMENNGFYLYDFIEQALAVINSGGTLPPAIPALGNILFVSALSGDDSTAEKGNIAMPWRNPTVANAAAVAGEVIVVLPGTYSIGNTGAGDDIDDDGNQQMVKDGVTLFMYAGAEIQYNNLSGTVSIPFSDEGSAAEINILGEGKFKFNYSINVNNDYTKNGFFFLNNPASELYWEFDSIDMRKRFRVSDMSSWIMKGRSILNRESQTFAMRLTTDFADKVFDIELDEFTKTNEAPNTQWASVGLRDFRDNCNINIDIQKITWTNGFGPGGLGFFYLEDMSDTTSLRINVNDMVRTGSDFSFSEHCITEVRINANRNYNVQSRGGVGWLRSFLSFGSTDSTSVMNFRGAINTHSVAGRRALVVENKTERITMNLDIEDRSLTGSGINLDGCLNTILTGRISNSGNRPAITPGNTLVQPYLKDLMVQTTGAAPSIQKQSPGANSPSFKIMRTYATIAPDLVTNGGITELIESVVADANV